MRDSVRRIGFHQRHSMVACHTFITIFGDNPQNRCKGRKSGKDVKVIGTLQEWPDGKEAVTFTTPLSKEEAGRRLA